MLSGENGREHSGSALRPVVTGAIIGVLLGFGAIFLALLSTGAGHGDYAAARALYPASMLLTLVEGSIGPLAKAVALLQFPFYGGLLGWAAARRVYLPAVGVGLLHLAGAIICFSGVLPNFS
jgi:hypothetical protein